MMPPVLPLYSAVAVLKKPAGGVVVASIDGAMVATVLFSVTPEKVKPGEVLVALAVKVMTPAAAAAVGFTVLTEA